MQVQEWFTINEQRSYPFRVKPETIPNDWILDAIFLVSDRKLPLKASRMSITPHTVSIVVEDADNQFVGVFCYHGTEIIELNPAANGCSGKLFVKPENIDASIADTYEVIRTPLEDSAIFEIRTTKILPKFKIPKIIIDRFNNPDLEYVDEVIIEDDEFLRFDIQEVNAITDKVILNSDVEYVPKCSLQVPLLSINGVRPNADGLISIRSDNAGLEPAVIDDNLIEIRSKYDIADFQRNRRLGPIGLAGIIGLGGFQGIDGSQICPSQCDTPEINQIQFAGVKYNGTNKTERLFSDLVNFSDLDRVSLFSTNMIAAMSSGTDNAAFATFGFTDFPGSVDWFILNTGLGNIHNDLAYNSNTLVVVGNGGIIQRFSLFGDFLNFVAFPTTDDILRVDSHPTGRFVVVTSAREVYEFNSGVFNNLNVPATEDITNAKYIDDSVMVCYRNGKAFDVGNSKFYDFGTSANVNDAYGEWLILDDGSIVRIHPDLSFSIDDTISNTSLHSIDGFGSDFVIAVGDGAKFLRFDGVSNNWTSIPSVVPQSTNLKDVAVGSRNDVYAFGE